jgi:hypothetical protein
MNDAKYIGLDVHQATISATVLDSMVTVLPIGPMTRIAKLGSRPCARRSTFLPGTPSCGTSLRVK